jgi:hypothetical protein
MAENIENLQEKIEKLEVQVRRQQSLIKSLLQELEELQGQEEEIPHIQCFFAMPFSEKYNPLFHAVTAIFEDAPYGWRIVRADVEHKAPTIHKNVEKHIADSHCYFADISERNVNVFLEIGRMSHYSRIPDVKHTGSRPILYLCDKTTEEDIASDLKGLIYHSYEMPVCNCSEMQSFTQELRKEFDKNLTLQSLRQAKKKEIYLSMNTLIRHGMCSKELAQKIASKFSTVETLLKVRAKDVANQLRIPEESAEISIVQHSLREHFLL